MRGIIVAAGLGLRMRPLTEARPKCMLPVGGRPLIENTKDNMRAAGCHEIVVVVGHMAEAVQTEDVVFVRNDAYAETNILHSLMAARDSLVGEVVCSYSDIWVEPGIYEVLMDTPGDIVLATDRDWLPYYAGREAHPVGEAENVLFDKEGVVRRIGKHIEPASAAGLECGEFLGLWRLSPTGAQLMRDTFEELDGRLGREKPFQRAPAWRSSYVTDLVQELVDRGVPVQVAAVERGWAELDTLEDFERLPLVAERQRLWTLCGSLVSG